MSTVTALAAATVAALLASVSTLTTVLGLAGVAVLTGGLWRRSRPVVTIAALCLLGATLLAGGVSTRPGLTLLAGVATLLSWTFAQTVVDLDHALGESPTGRLERTHVAGTTALVGGCGVVTYALYIVEWGTLPPLAVAALLVGAVSLVVALWD